MTEEKKMETTQSLACMDSSEFTFEQDQKLRMHFNKEPFPKEETMEALAEALKLTTRDIKVRFHRQSQRLHGAGGSSVPSLHPCPLLSLDVPSPCAKADSSCTVF